MGAMRTLIALLLLLVPRAAAQIECVPTLFGSVLNGAFFGHDWVIVTGDFSWTVNDPGTCPNDPCQFEWRVQLQIHSRTQAGSPILEMCTYTSYPMPAHCGPFPIPGVTQSDGTFLQLLDTQQRWFIECGRMLAFWLNWKQLFGDINLVKVEMACGGC